MEKVEGKTSQAVGSALVLEEDSTKSDSEEAEKEVFRGGAMGGGGGGITGRPKLKKGEAVVAEAGTKEEEFSAAAVCTKRPGLVEVDALAVSKRPRTKEEDAAGTVEEIASVAAFLRRIFEDKKILTRPHVAPGKDGKRRTVVRLDKEAVEIRMSLPPPEPFPRMSDELIDRLEELKGCPGQIRAEQDEMTAFGQKQIDRDAEMLEFTDD